MRSEGPTPTLPPLHDYQLRTVADVAAGIAQGVPANLVSSPTGTGKTIMQVHNLLNIPRGIQIVPSMEIAAGFARWLGLNFDRATLELAGVWTVKKLANELSAGRFDPTTVDWLQIDEAHHSVDETHVLVDTYLGRKPRVGFTATTYRGTPKETKKLLDWWGGNVTVALSEGDAIRRGFASAPAAEVVPLVNDELVSLYQGEFKTSEIEAQTEDKLEELIGGYVKKFFDPATGLWDRPTLLTLPTVHLIREAEKWFDHFGLPATAVTGEDHARLRQDQFRDTVARRKLLVNVKVVGEGVDLPLRRLIDCSPTMSPVLWRQRLGRIMRPVGPGEAAPHYVVTNHNLLRHGYLLKGIFPRQVFREARAAWGPEFVPSKRMVARAVGLEGLGRFLPNEIPLADGSFVWMFVLGTPDGNEQYATVVNPYGGDPVCARRAFTRDENNFKRYDLDTQWKRVKALPDMAGCTSVPAPPLTPNMRKKWAAAARIKGLDPAAEVNSRQYQILPFLYDLGGKFRANGELY